jgi:hypothetical protein
MGRTSPVSLTAEPDPSISAALLAAETTCRSRGVQLTPIRKTVLRTLWESARPLGAYEVMQRLEAGLRRRLTPRPSTGRSISCWPRSSSPRSKAEMLSSRALIQIIRTLVSSSSARIAEPRRRLRTAISSNFSIGKGAHSDSVSASEFLSFRACALPALAKLPRPPRPPLLCRRRQW